MVETKDPGYALTGANARYQVVVRDVTFYAGVGKLTVPNPHPARPDGIQLESQNNPG